MYIEDSSPELKKSGFDSFTVLGLSLFLFVSGAGST
jgi:hypothetical protein